MKSLAKCFLPVLGLIFVLPDASALANGGKGKVSRYVDRSGPIEFSIELDEKLFLLTSVKNKYKVLRIKIKSTHSKPLALSKTNDKVDLLMKDQRVAGILDLAKHDPSLWDSLDADTRNFLAYPETVPPREEESIFVFVPLQSITVIPTAVEYTIASLPEKIRLRPPVAKT
jgi:hypothetical protein